MAEEVLAMPQPTNEHPERYYARDRQEWRAWLEQNHAASRGIWLIYYKQQSSKPRVAYDEAVEEALCFGWIDSKAKALDEERYMQFFSPRKPKSPWSKLNKQRVEKLIQQGLMTSAGLQAIEAAQQNGMWDAADAIADMTVPEDFKQALAAKPAAQQHFEAFGTSTKREILRWIKSAKRPETRLKRIEQVVSATQQKKNPLQSSDAKKA